MLGDEFAGEAVCPEAGLAFAEGDLELERLGWEAVLVEEVEGVFEDLKMVVNSSSLKEVFHAITRYTYKFKKDQLT